ncbi:hypothetical protein LshimejAT787_0704520 [Lyophyllum shimeji]|uniref:Uncharacterized protein n=1 Tax=Lyophyllum shimeji TaxID=47721 RepID=A0A9P3UP38_LYOSH|nr:hypothetical protein LshimejAT787_0704520 [Lyophyllum shimeji]
MQLLPCFTQAVPSHRSSRTSQRHVQDHSSNLGEASRRTSVRFHAHVSTRPHCNDLPFRNTYLAFLMGGLPNPTTPAPGPGFGTTLISGVQPVAALLPLLGTEQCEEHVGSALSDGYLYAATAPVSIFGSLGIASAGFKALVASISVPRRKFLGAAKLRDVGFSPLGKNLSLIMMDRDNPGRYLAETQLDSLLNASQLEVLHVRDLRRLTITTAFLKWNSALVLLTAISCLVGVTPYVHLSLDPAGNRLDPFARWAFPALRVLGGFLSVTSIQFLVQLRLLAVLKTRLIFLALSNERGSLLKSLRVKLHLHWDPQTSSEVCLSELERLLRMLAHRDAESTREGLDWVALEQLQQDLEGANRHLFPGPGIQWSCMALQINLTLGILACVIGYVGCFSIVQGSSNNSRAPIVWLVLEGTLTIFRMVAWGYNPRWDDLEPIKLGLELGAHPPLSTCNKSADEIFGDKLLPLVRAKDFIRHTRLYTGFLKPVNNTDMSIYYTLTRRSAKGQGSSQRVLFITFVDKHERASKVYYVDNNQRAHVLAAEPPLVQPTYETLHTRILDPTDHAHLPITGNTLASHYQSIMKQVQPRIQGSRMPVDEQMIPWALSVDHADVEEGEGADHITQGIRAEKDRLAEGTKWVLSSDDSNTESEVEEFEDEMSPKWDDDDLGQFPHGILQRKRQRRSANQQGWIERLLSEVESRTQTEMEAFFEDENPTPHAIEMRQSALILERFGLECLFLYETWTWECQLWRDHNTWVDLVVTKRAESDPKELLARLNADWVRYARARLAEDEASTRARLAKGKEAFIATFSGVPDVNARVLKKAWHALQTSVEIEWRKTINICGKEGIFLNSTARLPFQPPNNVPQPATASICSGLVDSLEHYARRVEEAITETFRRSGNHRDLSLHKFWTKEREKRFRGERLDVVQWIDGGLSRCDAALGCTENCPLVATMVVSPLKWTLITPPIIHSEGMPALSRALRRNPYLRMVAFRDFENDVNLARALRAIVPRTASSLTTITILGPIHFEGTAALAEIVRSNPGIRSISVTDSTLTSLMILVDQVAQREPPYPGATSITFRGFGTTPFGTGPRSKQILCSWHDFTCESEVELRFFGPVDGHHLQLALLHGSNESQVENSGTAVTLRFNASTTATFSRFIPQARVKQEFISLFPNEDFIPGFQNVVTITPSGNPYTILSIDLLDKNGLPYGDFEEFMD